jgi:hypothetical protein
MAAWAKLGYVPAAASVTALLRASGEMLRGFVFLHVYICFVCMLLVCVVYVLYGCAHLYLPIRFINMFCLYVVSLCGVCVVRLCTSVSANKVYLMPLLPQYKH